MENTLRSQMRQTYLRSLVWLFKSLNTCMANSFKTTLALLQFSIQNSLRCWHQMPSYVCLPPHQRLYHLDLNLLKKILNNSCSCHWEKRNSRMRHIFFNKKKHIVDEDSSWGVVYWLYISIVLRKPWYVAVALHKWSFRYSRRPVQVSGGFSGAWKG